MGKEGPNQTKAGTARAPGGGGRAFQTNRHVNQKSSGRAYNSSLETNPCPTPIKIEAGVEIPGHTLTVSDRKLRSVYGYHIHCNDDTSSPWRVADYSIWHTQWRLVSNLTTRFYDTPKGKADRRFFTLLTEELRGAQERRWNSKRPMVFIGTVLAKIPGVKNSKDIRARLLSRMDHWKDGLIGALVEETCRTENSCKGRAGEIRERDREEQESTAYGRTIKAGHIRVAVQQATNRGKEGCCKSTALTPILGFLSWTSSASSTWTYRRWTCTTPTARNLRNMTHVPKYSLSTSHIGMSR